MDDRVVWAPSPSFPVAFPREPAGGSVAAVKSTGQGGPSRAQKAAQCPQNCGAPGPGAGHLRRGARARKEAWGRRVGMGVVHRQHSAPGDPGPPTLLVTSRPRQSLLWVWSPRVTQTSSCP